MSDTSLTMVKVTRRVTYTVVVGFTVADLNQVKMRPTRGYISLVSMTTRTLSILHGSPLLSLMQFCR
jgi:hypothetical protein